MGTILYAAYMQCLNFSTQSAVKAFGFIALKFPTQVIFDLLEMTPPPRLPHMIQSQRVVFRS